MSIFPLRIGGASCFFHGYRYHRKEYILIYNVFALRRSGHHAIIDWMIDCLGGDGREDIQVANNVFEYRSSTQARLRNLTLAECGMRPGVNILIANYEDVLYRERCGSRAYAEIVRKSASPVVDVLVIRDIYNLFASRIRRAEAARSESGWRPLTDIESVWREHVSVPTALNTVKIFYNLWLESEWYRMVVVRSLGFGCCRSPSGEVSVAGGGSSFDALRFRRNASVMNLMRRWEDLMTPDLPLYLSLLRDISTPSRTWNEELFGIKFHHVYDSVVRRMRM